MTRISNNSSGGLSGFISKMTKTDALAPIVALEATVVVGRTIQAYKRGGKDEARERFFEEIMGSIVWLYAVKAFNKIGDKILGKILNVPGAPFDVGTDKVLRTPFENFMKDGKAGKFTKGQVAAMKGAKVLISVLLGNLIIGVIVPKINHYMTNTLRHKRFEEAKKNENQNSNDILEINKEPEEKALAPSFKGGGGFGALNWFTNAIENTNTGKLLSTDVGCCTGRMYNARTKEERREIAIRDIGSIYFYMWASGHIRDLLNYVESGTFKRLSPDDAELLQKQLREFLAKRFREGFIGKNPAEFKVPQGIKFESGKLSIFDKFLNKFRKVPVEPLQVAKVSDVEKVIKDKDLLKRIKDMAKLQPERMNEAVITKQQIIDAMNVSEINNPKFLSNAFNKFTNNASSDKYRYVSNSSLYDYKKQMQQYVEQICKKAKDGKITSDLLKKFERKNYIASGANFLAGFAVSALFLSTLIPKIQYWVTRTKTGVDAFPGIYDYENNKEVDA